MNTIALTPRTTSAAPAAPQPRTSVGAAAAVSETNPAAPRQAPRRWLAGLLIADAALAFAPVAVLGNAIGWPASLGQPAATQLTAIASAPAAVGAGYGLYLLYSLLVAPLMIGAAARVFGGLNSPWATMVAAFAALSALARSIGILRWLTVMPALALSHRNADPAQRQQIELLFDAVHRYGGGIGEVLGVSLLMAAALGTLSLAAWRQGGMPKPLAALGALAAVLLAGLSAPAFGASLELPVALPVSLLSLWMLAWGVWLLRQRA